MTRFVYWLFIVSMLTNCGGGEGVKTVNVDRTTTNTIAIPKTALCPKPEEIPPLPALVIASEDAGPDGRAAAAAANAEAYARYSKAVSVMLDKCRQGVQ